ncbi:DUF6420 family protein [Allorhodopirellula solitaria]|uniref:DUF6420 family protein n=1 Tax=Allorhodopirellula solitaria TaxID=2527987 RepID=UPI001C93B0FF
MIHTVGVGQRLHARRTEPGGERVVVIKQARRSHARIVLDIIVVGDPLQRRLDSRILFRQPRENHALQTRVTHRPVTAQSAVGRISLVRCAGVDLRCWDLVVESAIIHLASECGVIVLGIEVLAAGNEQESPLDRSVLGPLIDGP